MENSTQVVSQSQGVMLQAWQNPRRHNTHPGPSLNLLATITSRPQPVLTPSTTSEVQRWKPEQVQSRHDLLWPRPVYWPSVPPHPRARQA